MINSGICTNTPIEVEANTYFRFKYPQSEASFNMDNHADQVSKMGADENNIKVWWM